VAALAAKQFGVVSADQLKDLGLSHDTIRRRAERGVLQRLYKGVFAVGHARMPREGRLLAVLLTCGPSSFLSHRTAAAVWGLRSFNPYSLEVTVPGTNVAKRPGVTVHRTGSRLGMGEVRNRGLLRVSSVPRLLVELAPRETLKELRRLVELSVRKRLLDVAGILETLERYERRPGLHRLQEAFEGYVPKPQRRSGLEDDFAELLSEIDAPEPQHNVYLHGWEVDFYWPEFKLVVELDGSQYHRTVDDLERDRYRDAHLLTFGIRTLRITEFRMRHDREGVKSHFLALARFPAG
jgi:hypothetical protein